MNVEIRLKMNEVPDINRHRFLSYIKTCIRNSDEDYFRKIYGDQSESIDDDGNLIIPTRPFVFGIRLSPSKIRIEKSNILDPENNISVMDHYFIIPQNAFISLYVSSIDTEFITNLYKGAMSLRVNNQLFSFGNNIFVKTLDVLLYDSPVINQNFLIIKTLSPILLNDDGSASAIKCENLDIIKQKINEISDSVLKKVRNDIYGNPQGLYKPLNFTPIECQDTFVKHTLSALRQERNSPYLVYACIKGSFVLEGDPRDLTTLSIIGLGRRRGQGFGYVVPILPNNKYYSSMIGRAIEVTSVTLKTAKAVMDLANSKNKR